MLIVLTHEEEHRSQNREGSSKRQMGARSPAEGGAAA
jgi:hypothetical protein